MNPTEPAPLTRERILEAAFALASTEGVAALSMRRLGRRLGVEAMSLYNHVANKEAILDGIVDRLMGEIDLPLPEEDWQQGMRRRAYALRALLLRHPWALRLLDSRASPRPATLRHHDAVIATLRRGGLSLADTAHALMLIDSYIYGFVLQEQVLPLHLGEQVEAVRQSLPADEFPYFTELVVGHILQPGYSPSHSFDFGLALILDGLARASGGE